MPDELATRELRDGRYVLIRPLGQGGQGTTWDAIDKREGRPVAVKVFDVRGASAWKDVELAEREARVLSTLDHPLLPHYFEHFEEGGALYLVMEKVHGTALSVVHKKGPRMSEKDATRFLLDADRALTYLHGRNPPVIHRDIKPGNVIRRSDGSYVFVDFGAVRDHLRPEGGSTVVGTFGYMAPEQFQGRAGPASDVYSVGATVLTLMTGTEPEKLPHRGLGIDVHAALGQHVDPRLLTALTRMLEPDPDTRATRIAPLLDDGSRPPSPPRSSRDGRYRGKHARRETKREAKRARREARRWSRSDPLPPFVRILFHVGLAIAIVAVTLAVRVIVPFVLTLLSFFFGQGLRRAARSVRDAGADAVRAIQDSQEELDGRMRVAASQHADEPRIRVESPGQDEEDLEPEDDEEEPNRKRHVRR